jgi:hypothetical protein
MSSTNPHDPVGQLTHTPAGVPSHDNHGGSGPPSNEVIERGYEADVYDARTVLSVPLLVILFFVLAFGTVTIVFSFIAYPKPNPNANPLAARENAAPLNDRMKRIYRGPNDGTGQARLEPLVLREGGERARAMTQTALPVSDGNSPELHPEDLIATPERFPALYVTTGDRIGLDKTMNLKPEALKQLFPVQKNGEAAIDSQHVPTAANAGRGAADSLVLTPGTPPTAPNPKGGHP